KFNKFMTEALTYIEDGHLPKRKHVQYISHHLEGKAYDFYNNTVSSNPRRWKTTKFFTGLFDYCFPVDFRDNLRMKIRRCHQDNRTVKEYVFELTELLNMIGTLSKRDKVVKLWGGFNKSIQAKLWDKEDLSPEHSSWETVIRNAERCEISLAAG
ncbi:hypothetical protein NEOLEDRAFT_1050895, partial [Neolentinus lepideus HHB14362 ss-1]